MNPEILHTAEALKAKINSGVAQKVSLYDFASQYAVDLDLINQSLILDLNFSASLGMGNKGKVKEEMIVIIDKIVSDYEEQRLSSRNAKIVELETKLNTTFEKRKKENKLVVSLKDIEKNYASSNFKMGPTNAEFRLGEITGIVGFNANGKTTLFKIIAGMISADEGVIDFPYFQSLQKRKISWPEIKHQTAYVPQEITEHWPGSLKDNLHYAASIHGIYGKDNDMAVEFIINRLGLSDHIDKRWNELSGGFKLRFALAKALVWKPALLIIDEPLANLDVSAQILILNDLKDLAHSFKNPFCVLISSQHLHEIECVADNIIVMDNGVIKYNGKLENYGLNRLTNIFEFSTDHNQFEMKQLLGDFAYKRLEHNGIHYILYVSKDTERKAFLDYCSMNNINLSYFRDISTSIKKFFLEDHIDNLNLKQQLNMDS